MSGDLPTPSAAPVRILSDLHLGHPACRIQAVESLRPLIAGAGTVIFNGDTCEQAFRGWRDEGKARLRELMDLCSEENAKPVFLPGNHDPEIAKEGWIELAAGKVLITHGHAIYPEVAPWSPEYLNRKKKIRQLIEQREASDRDRDRDLGHHWETVRMITEMLKPNRRRYRGKGGRKYLLSALWPPERCFNILRVWLGMAKQAGRFVDRFRPGAKVFLFGHFHRPGVWRGGGTILCNTGAFMRGSRAILAEFREGQVRVYPVLKNEEAFHLGKQRTVIRLGESAVD